MIADFHKWFINIIDIIMSFKLQLKTQSPLQ